MNGCNKGNMPFSIKTDILTRYIFVRYGIECKLKFLLEVELVELYVRFFPVFTLRTVARVYQSLCRFKHGIHIQIAETLALKSQR